jgi:hypothetical protein
MVKKPMVHKTVQRLADYQKVFGTAEGKRVLNDLMDTHYFASSTFDPCPYKTALREGERNAIIRIFALLKIDVNTVRERIQSHELEE